jgi:hypothetical protein
VETVNSPDEQALHAQLAEARKRLDGLVRDLGAIDDELEGLAAEREQYRLLAEVCGSLERLDELGATELFWGQDADGTARDHLGRVRDRVKAFRGRLEEIEERRRSVVHAIQLQQDDTDILEDDVFEAQLREERRKLEWIVEREIDSSSLRPSVMPWNRGGEDDQRFRKSLAASLLIGLLLGLLLPLIDLPLPERWEPVDVPDRLARLIREERPLPPPQQQPTPEQLEPDPEVVAETTPEPQTQKNAESKGILAFREKFSGLAQHSSSARLGSQARISSVADAANGRPTRSMVATAAPGSSGGINLASLSRDVGGGGGGGIEGVQVVRATSAIGGGGTSERPLSNGPGPGRTDEEIQIVFDRHKAALYRLYNRELRRAGQRHERAATLGTGGRARGDLRLRCQGRRAGDHDSVSDRLPAGHMSRRPESTQQKRTGERIQALV